jgi:CBS domain containing-hemolysin-like protein
MNGQIAAWLGHPVTLLLAAALLGLFLLVVEVLLRSLGEMGNVRFQGMLEDHQKLLPVEAETLLHLSRLTDVLRWLEVASAGLLWAVLFRIAGGDWLARVSLGVLVPVGLIVVARLLIGAVSEDVVVNLLRLVRPLVWPLIALAARFDPGPQEQPPEADDDEEVSEREIRAYLQAGHAAGIFEREDTAIVESLVDFFDTVVREVMTPRTDMVALPDSASIEEALDAFVRSRKSRIPLYHETVDQIVGVVHVKNLVRHLRTGKPATLAALAHPCLVVPESKELGELVRDFQRERQQMAIVVDEYGGTSGLVTLEDVFEEIVGDLQDEHEERQPPEWEELEPGVYRLQGRAGIEVLAELYDVDVSEDDIDTIGGLVFSRHGTVPEAGATVEDHDHGLVFTVDEMDGRRIVSVTARRSESGPQPSEA